MNSESVNLLDRPLPQFCDWKGGERVGAGVIKVLESLSVGIT